MDFVSISSHIAMSGYFSCDMDDDFYNLYILSKFYYMSKAWIILTMDEKKI